MGRRRYSPVDPTAHQAIRNVTRPSISQAQPHKTRRRIVDEFPAIFAGLNPAQMASITLAAAKHPDIRDAWDITADHLEQAKAEYFRDAR